MLRRPEVSYRTLPSLNGNISEEVAKQVEISVKYAGYIERQTTSVDSMKAMDTKRIPVDFDYSQITGLKTEAREKLGHIRPATIAQAARISGINPSDIHLLLVHLKRASLCAN
jgi:tRNA uridine 5-carboxymethylaminomethyl modification enzyme